MLDQLLKGVGDFASQVKNLDGETKTLLARLLVRANKSGDVNGYLKERLTWLFAAEDQGHRPPSWRIG